MCSYKFLDIYGPELHRENKNKISLYNNLPKEICLKLPTMCLKSLNFVALELIF